MATDGIAVGQKAAAWAEGDGNKAAMGSEFEKLRGCSGSGTCEFVPVLVGENCGQLIMAEETGNLRQFFVRYLQDVGVVDAPCESFAICKRRAEINVDDANAVGTQSLNKVANGMPRADASLGERANANG